MPISGSFGPITGVGANIARAGAQPQGVQEFSRLLEMLLSSGRALGGTAKELYDVSAEGLGAIGSGVKKVLPEAIRSEASAIGGALSELFPEQQVIAEDVPAVPGIAPSGAPVAARAPAPPVEPQPPTFVGEVVEKGPVEKEKEKLQAPKERRWGRGLQLLGLGLGQAQAGVGAPSPLESIGGFATAMAGIADMATQGGKLRDTGWGKVAPALAIFGTLINLRGQQESLRRRQTHRQRFTANLKEALVNLRSL